MKITMRAGIALFAGMVAVTAAGAADDPIVTRKALMKSVGASIKATAPMVKGEAPYDAVTAELAMRTVHAAAAGFGHYFPEGSDMGLETEASPKIWEDMAGFTAKLSGLETDAAAAIPAAAEGADAFKGAFMKLTQNCKGCHEDYRIKKD